MDIYNAESLLHDFDSEVSHLPNDDATRYLGVSLVQQFLLRARTFCRIHLISPPRPWIDPVFDLPDNVPAALRLQAAEVARRKKFSPWMKDSLEHHLKYLYCRSGMTARDAEIRDVYAPLVTLTCLGASWYDDRDSIYVDEFGAVIFRNAWPREWQHDDSIPQTE